MKRIALMLVWAMVPALAAAQNFAGRYTFQDKLGTSTMIIEQDAKGKVSGTIMLDDGSLVDLKGEVKGSDAIGISTLNGKSSLFRLQFKGTQLIFTMIGVTADNKPDLEHGQSFPFTPEDSVAAATAPAGAAGDPAGGRASANPLAGGSGAGDFVGEFTDNNLFLELQGGGGRYQGEVELQGKTYPVTARSSDGQNLAGQFTSDGRAFDFTARLHGGMLTFTTGDTTYQLHREDDGDAAADHPVAGTGATAASDAVNTAAGAAHGSNPGVAGGADGIVRDPRAPATPGRLSDNNPQSLQWLNHLRGKLLSQLSSYTSGTAGGYSSNRRMLLYPNGRFEYYSASSVSVQSEGPEYTASGSSGGQGVQRGTWRIVTAQGTSFLALVFEGTAKEDYVELDYRNGKTFVDGTRTFVTNPQ